MDDAVICTGCGCSVGETSQIKQVTSNEAPASKSSVILGIIGIVGGILFAIVGHICSIISIIFGIRDYTNKKKMTGLILGIIGEVISIFSSIIGAVVGASMF